MVAQQVNTLHFKRYYAQLHANLMFIFIRLQFFSKLNVTLKVQLFDVLNFYLVTKFLFIFKFFILSVVLISQILLLHHIISLWRILSDLLSCGGDIALCLCTVDSSCSLLKICCCCFPHVVIDVLIVAICGLTS